MKNFIIITLFIIFGILISGCSQQKIPVYGIGQEVKFIDENQGSITLNNDSGNSRTQVNFSFTLNLNETFMFNDLFSHYGIAVGNTGFDLRVANDESSPTNLVIDYIITIDNVTISFEELDDYQLQEGIRIITFSFGENYIEIDDKQFSFTLLNDEIIPKSVFEFKI